MKSWMKAAIAVAGSVLVGTAIDPASAQGETIAPGMEENTDRPGADYSSFTITSRDPASCKRACLADDRCNAWTYVRPGVQGEMARCYFKNPVPAAVASTCCISGVRDQYEPSVADAVRQPPPAALDEVSRLKAEVKKLKEDIVRLSSTVKALENHTHEYSTPSFGYLAIPCNKLQPGATGSCYVMLNPKTAQPQTQPPTK